MKTFFWRLPQKEVFMVLWKRIWRQKLHKKLFGQVWGNSGKILCTPKICLLLHLWWKGTSAPVAPLLKGQRRKCPRHGSILGVPVPIILHALSLLVVVGYKCVTVMNINYQRSPKTEQFTTAKVSGNALKHGSRTHSVLRQRSSQLQKYKAARIPCCIAIDQKVCGLDGGHPG